jgi:NAD(P)-dependent dehydrogenase (short-subunit alcohol dehydrogenase family)
MSVFLVTGASRGLGRSIVEMALEEGHQVLGTARNIAALSELANRYPETLRTFSHDVTDPSAATAAVATAVREFGRLDVVVNNAGYANVAAVEDMSLEDFRAQLDTNLMGVVNVSKAVLPQLRAQGGGHIIQVSSVGGRLASVGLGAYQAAKWAVGGFSEVLAQEVRPLGIKVSVLEPGGMRTDWAGSSMTIWPVSEPYRSTVGAFAQMLGHGGGNTAGDPRKVARVVLRISELDDPPLRLLLGSDAARYAAAAEQQRAESDRRWRHLTLSTDHDDATEADLDPMRLRLPS